MKTLTKIATAGGVAALALGGATASASAAYSITSSPGGAQVAAGTTFSGSSSSISLINPANGQTVSNCTSSTLSGTVGPTTGASLNITGGSFSSCKTAGSTVTVTGNYSPAWVASVTAGNGTTTPYTGPISGVKVTVGPCTYTGSLTPITANNGTSTSVTSLVLNAAGTLTRSGCTSSIYPTTAQVTGTYTLTTVGGAAASPTNDLVIAGP